MAARTVAAAHGSVLLVFFLLFLVCFSYVFSSTTSTYSRQMLLDIGYNTKLTISAESGRIFDIPDCIARPPGAPWIVIGSDRRRRRRRERKQKRGCRSGLLAKLRSNPHKPPLPSMFLTNARSLLHKMDELELLIEGNRYVRDCCISIISETWLHPSIPDAAVQLAGRATYRSDRNKDSGKSRGGGLCIYVHNDWSNNNKVMHTHCSPDIELISVKARPFFLPRELTVVLITAVYIPPDANTSIALSMLADTINKLQRSHPDGVHIVAGDFNQANLKSILPKFYQHVSCATRGKNTLDHVYTNFKHAYRAIQYPNLAQSDHMSLLLAPAYTPLRRSTTPVTKTITTWPEDALPQLQNCFQHTDWSVFEHPDLSVHTEAVLSYIKFCIGNVTVEKRIRVFPNQKPWMSGQVRALLKARNTAFRSGDKELYSAARANLKRGIREAKAEHKERIESHLSNNNPRQVWQGIQQITNFRGQTISGGDSSIALAEELNSFFARFEAPALQSTATPPVQSHPAPSSQLLTVQVQEVERMLKTINTRKASGPDGVPGKVLKACAAQLAPVFTEIFNLSLTQSTIPACMKSATIIPIPKKSAIVSHKDYRPIALTPIITKCLERLVQNHIRSCLPPSLDPHQFAYRENRSTEDAIAITLHTALSHLEHRESYVRMLFIDYSSAFNTIIPDILVSKLTDLGIPPRTCTWIKDFLTDRPQTVKLGPHLSSTRTLSTGSPQGCVLSPLLYTLYTTDCRPAHPSNTIVKFADDTTVVGLITGEDESAYRDEVLKLSEWCLANNLFLNITKTKEIILDFRKHRLDPPPLYIHGDRVERVHTFTFLGTVITDNLSWSANTSAVFKKAQQRLHFLRVLRKNNICEKLLVTFYRSTIESILTFCIAVWFSHCTEADRKRLQRVVRTAEKIIGCPLPSLKDIYASRCLRKAVAITRDSTHPANHLFDLLPSGRRYRSVRTRTSRLRDSFFPQAITALNTTSRAM